MLGALPATGLCLLAGWVILGGVLVVEQGDPFGIVVVVWSAAGIAGTLALWAVVFGRRSSAVRWGLIVGLLANLPVSAFVISTFAGLQEAAMGTLIVSQALVAVYWLVELSGKNSLR